MILHIERLGPGTDTKHNSVVAIIVIYRYLRFFNNHLIVSLGKIKIFLKNNLIVIKNKDFF